MGSHGENHRHSAGARRVRAVPRCRRGRGRGVGRCGTCGGCARRPDGRLPARGDHRGSDMRVGAGEVARARPGGVLRCEFVCSRGGYFCFPPLCTSCSNSRGSRCRGAWRRLLCYCPLRAWWSRRVFLGRSLRVWALCLRWRGCCPGGRACCLPSATCGIGPGTSFARTSCSAWRGRAVSCGGMAVRSLARTRYPSAP